MTLGERLERSQLPRRLLGAILAVLVPGAGHVVLGYGRAGWIVAALTLAVGAGFVGCVLATAMVGVGVFGATYILGTIASVLSIFALPPGPRLKDGLRALWPVLVLFLVFRGAAYGVQRWGISGEYAPDATMAPRILRGDLVLCRVGGTPAVGDVLVVEHPAGSEHHFLRKVTAIDGDTISLGVEAPDPAAEAIPAVPRGEVRGRALFVFAAARGTNGVGRVWRPLR